LKDRYFTFAGQRDDGFYADIQSIFDLDFSFGRDRNTPTKPFDSQGGFNVHTIVLDIPLSQLGGAKIAGVYATTSHWDRDHDHLTQVGRQGNPLFCEALVAKVDKDRYNETPPKVDAAVFAKYADNPELAHALGTTPIIPGLLHSIFIPDLIKVDLTTPPARLAGATCFNRLGVFGGDVLKSTAQDPFKNGGFIPGGWPNGRRFGDDVVNIALIALGAAGPFGSIDPNYNGTRVEHNDETYNQVFPYAGTPHNIGAMSARLGMNKFRLTSLVRLSYLAPGVIRAFLAGRHPLALTPARLLRLSKDLPHDWQEQRRFLEFAA
jgi:hypothetical protein